jgi:predicted small secreted protein
MSKSYLLLSLVFVAALIETGCQNTAQIMGQDKDKAVDTAVQRGRFEMDCPKAIGSVLSSNMLQPALWGGMERAEYTIGVEGCGKRSTYLVVCQVDSPSCFAISGSRNAPMENNAPMEK